MKKLIILTIAVLTVGLLPIVLNFGVINSSDFINQQIPFILETKRMLSTGTPFWSWNTFSGSNFIGGYSFYALTSPFVWIAVLFPYKYILWGILLVTYLKFLAASLAAFWLLKRIGFNEKQAVIGGLLYCFSNFFVCNLYYFHFAEPIIMFPLLLVAIENVIDGHKNCFAYLALAVFGVVFINYYFAVSSLILGFLYLILRSFSLRQLSWKLICKSIFAVLVGIGLSAFILLPVYLDVAQSSRGIPGRGFGIIEIGGADVNSNLFRHIGRMITRVLSLFFPTLYENIPADDLITNGNWTSTEAYLMIFGCLTSIVHFLKVRNWLSWLIAGLVVVYLIPPLNGVFTLFTSLTYGRWLYGLLLLMIIATLDLWRRGIVISAKQLVIYLLLCLIGMAGAFLFSWLTASNGEFVVDSSRRVEFAVVLLNFACLVFWFFIQSNHFRLTAMIVCICALANLWAFAYFFGAFSAEENGQGALSVKPSLFEGYDVMKGARADDLSDFVNSAMISNRPGIYSFHSVYPKSMTPFRAAIDEDPASPIFTNSFNNRSSVATLMSVKNIRIYSDFSDSIPFQKENLTLIKKTGDYDEYLFNNHIPMGFAYDSFIVDDEVIDLIAYADSIDIPLILLDNLAVKQEDAPEFSKYLKMGVINNHPDIDSLVERRNKFTVIDFEGTSHGYAFKTDFDEPKAIFLSVPFDEGFEAVIDSDKTKLFSTQLGMTSIIIPPGDHVVTVSYVPRGLVAGAAISFVALIVIVGMVFVGGRSSKGVNS